MPTILPFRAIRFAGGADLARVTAPPYDLIPSSEREHLESLHPHNVVRLILGIEEPGAPDDRYAVAAEHLRRWLADGVLVRDDAERIYLYRTDYLLGGAPATTSGVVAALVLEPFAEGPGGGGIFPHERTIPGPKADRLALMRTTRANLEPLWFVAGRPMPGVLGALAGAAAARPPIADLLDPAGVRHRLWALDPGEGAVAVEAVASTPLVMADGHHRYETALAYQRERRAAGGPGPWDLTLALVADPADHRPALLPIHRAVGGVTAEQVGTRVALEPFEGPGGLEALAAHVAARGPGTIGVAAQEGRWTMASPGPLDSAHLAAAVVDPLGGDVTYEHDLGRLGEAVAGGAVAFLLAPVPLEMVLERAVAGVRMPPKTTLFWPKPRTGLLLRDLEPPGG